MDVFFCDFGEFDCVGDECFVVVLGRIGESVLAVDDDACRVESGGDGGKFFDVFVLDLDRIGFLFLRF